MKSPFSDPLAKALKKYGYGPPEPHSSHGSNHHGHDHSSGSILRHMESSSAPGEGHTQSRTGNSYLHSTRSVKTERGKSFTGTKRSGKKKRKVSHKVKVERKKFKKIVRKAAKIPNTCHGKKATFRLSENTIIPGHIQPSYNGTVSWVESTPVSTTTSVSFPNECATFGFPILGSQQTEAEIRIGESASGSGIPGLIDPPSLPCYASGTVGYYAVDLVKKNEVVMLDSYAMKMYFTNVGTTKVQIEIEEWVCKQSTENDIFSEAWKAYNQQDIVGGAMAGDVPAGTAAIDVFNQYTNCHLTRTQLNTNPDFIMGKIPHFSKFWKRGNYSKFIELLPGEGFEDDLIYKNVKLDLGLLTQVYDVTESAEAQTGVAISNSYWKNVSRFIVVRHRGAVGLDVKAAGGNARAPAIGAFEATQIAWRFEKIITAHRVDMWGNQPKRI